MSEPSTSLVSKERSLGPLSLSLNQIFISKPPFIEERNWDQFHNISSSDLQPSIVLVVALRLIYCSLTIPSHPWTKYNKYNRLCVISKSKWTMALDLSDGQFSERYNVNGSFSTAMRYRLLLEKLNIAIVAIIFLDHRERLFFDFFAHFRTDYFAIIHWLTGIIRKEVILEIRCSVTSWLCTTG